MIKKTRTKKLFAILCFILAPLAAAHAQTRSSPFLYMWSEPGSTSSQYSSVAPAWYRNPQEAPGSGPRVRVYYGSRLVDDTALSVDERKALIPQPSPPKNPLQLRARSL